MFKNSYLSIREPQQIKEYYYFILNLKTIVLIENQIFHFFRCKDRKWFCDTCLCDCKQKYLFKEICASFSTNFLTDNTTALIMQLQYIGFSAGPAGPAAAGPMFMVRRPSDMFKLLHSRISAYYRSVDH